MPCIIVSPWTVGGYVASDLFDHTSQLRFLEQVTGVVAKNISGLGSNTIDIFPGVGFGDPRNAGLGSYEDGTCPTCERIQDHEILFHTLVHAGLTEDDVDDVINAFRKVHAKRAEL